MSADPEDALEPAVIKDYEAVIEDFSNETKKLLSFKDMFYENHPIQMGTERDAMLEEKKAELAAKFEAIDETTIPTAQRAKFLYLKGCCFNITSIFDQQALECLSKAVKLDPTYIQAWNELGECYWKNCNLVEAQACFEGALNQKRNNVSLRSLSILLRQNKAINHDKAAEAVLKSVEFAKEAVALDAKDGKSWSILGNAYLCQYFIVAQSQATLKLAMSAYKLAWQDPVAKGLPDLHFNMGLAFKYGESYDHAIESFKLALRLDPPWQPPLHALMEMVGQLHYIDNLLKSKGKIKAKKIRQMVTSMDRSMFGDILPGSLVNVNNRKITLKHMKLEDMQDGDNLEKVVMGRVVGSLQTKNSVPFAFAIVDESMACVAVNVYNWADGRGVIIGDCVAIPEPRASTHKHSTIIPETIANEIFLGANAKDSKTSKAMLEYNFRTIRINDPTLLRVNGKQVGQGECAKTYVTSTYEAY